MKVQFGELDQIISDSSSKSIISRTDSPGLTQFLNVITSLIEKGETFKLNELALFTKSLQQFLNLKDKSPRCSSIQVGEIYNVDCGINYEPEMSYNHPALILEQIGDLYLIIPTSTSSLKIQQSINYSSRNSGNWYYYRVGRSDGFAQDCALILGNATIISPKRLLEKKGQLTCNLSDNNSLYRIIRRLLLENIFKKEFHDNKEHILQLIEKNKELERRIKELETYNNIHEKTS